MTREEVIEGPASYTCQPFVTGCLHIGKTDAFQEIGFFIRALAATNYAAARQAPFIALRISGLTSRSSVSAVIGPTSLNTSFPSPLTMNVSGTP